MTHDTTTDTDTGRPLSDEAVRMIRLRHAAEVPEQLHSANGLTPVVRRSRDVLAYSPKDGRRLGSLGTPAVAAHRSEVVALDSFHLPSVEELEAIRIGPDGKVHQ